MAVSIDAGETPVAVPVPALRRVLGAIPAFRFCVLRSIPAPRDDETGGG